MLRRTYLKENGMFTNKMDAASFEEVGKKSWVDAN